MFTTTNTPHTTSKLLQSSSFPSRVWIHIHTAYWEWWDVPIKCLGELELSRQKPILGHSNRWTIMSYCFGTWLCHHFYGAGSLAFCTPFENKGSWLFCPYGTELGWYLCDGNNRSKKDQYRYYLTKCCILPTRLWFILSSESTQAATHPIVLATDLQSTDSMQPFRNSSNKSEDVPWHGTLYLSISKYLIPLSRTYRALFHKWPRGKSRNMLHTMNGYALTCTAHWGGWIQLYLQIGKDNVWLD